MARIIVADDSSLALTFYSHILDYLGHEVVLCDNGLVAVEAFKKEASDFVILDMEMPGLDGDLACAEIRKMPCGITVPIIIVSAHDDEKDILRAMNAGANDYLVKPVRELHLISKLKTFLYTSSLHKKDIDLVKNHALFNDRYRIEKLIGYGSHSVIFLAADTGDKGRKTALKLMNSCFNTEEIRKPFLEIAEKVRRVSSNYVVKILNCATDKDGRIFIAMEYVNGNPLSSLLKRRRMNEYEVSKMAFDLIRALEAFKEQGVVHLDLRPENIIISEDVSKIADFGISKTVEGCLAAPIAHELWGTASYLPPEVHSGKSPASSRSDIYSLGIVIYEALTGDNPFHADRASVSVFRQLNFIPPSLRYFNQNIHPVLSDVIDLMLRKSPDERPSLRELARIFQNLLDFFEIKYGVKDGTYGSKSSESRAEIPRLEYRTDTFDNEKKLSGELAEIRGRIYRSSFNKASFMGERILKLFFAFSVIIIFGSIIYYSYGIVTGTPGAKQEKGMSFQTMCPACGNIEVQKVKELNHVKCSKCGAHVGKAMICADCGKKFPLMPVDSKKFESKDEYFKKLEETIRCPGCGSSHVKPFLKME